MNDNLKFSLTKSEAIVNYLGTITHRKDFLSIKKKLTDQMFFGVTRHEEFDERKSLKL